MILGRLWHTGGPCHLCVSRKKMWDTSLLSGHLIFFRMNLPGSSPVLQQFSADHAAAVCKQQLHFTLEQGVF